MLGTVFLYPTRSRERRVLLSRLARETMQKLTMEDSPLACLQSFPPFSRHRPCELKWAGLSTRLEGEDPRRRFNRGTRLYIAIFLAFIKSYWV